MPIKLTQEQALVNCQKTHRNKYDYSKMIYTGGHNKIEVICSKHGSFHQSYLNHINGSNCPKCSEISRRNKKTKKLSNVIHKANLIYNFKYNYEHINESKYKNMHSLVPIECNIHGIFYKTFITHILLHCGCPKCSKNYSPTTEEFINKANQKHKSKYDYSKFIYKDNNTKGIIICLVDGHNEFQQTPHAHLAGAGCPRCNGGIAISQEEAIRKCQLKHGNNYGYSKTIYKGNHRDIEIECLKDKTHGFFWQDYSGHVDQGHGCPKCSGKYSPSTEEYIQKAKIIWKNKYNYDKTIYVNTHSSILIYCNSCKKYFSQNAADHLSGHGCSRCCQTHHYSTEEFIEVANKIHGNNYYCYDKTIYKNSKTAVLIFCYECGLYFLQKPTAHLAGHGCPRCKESKGEKFITKFLKDNKINFDAQKRYNDCRDKNPLPFDFILLDNNLLIEFDGILHYKAHKRYGGIERLKYVQYHDALKNQYCKDNNIPLLRIPYWLLRTPEIIEEMILNFIKDNS